MEGQSLSQAVTKWIIRGPMWKQESVNKRCMELDMNFELMAMF